MNNDSLLLLILFYASVQKKAPDEFAKKANCYEQNSEEYTHSMKKGKENQSTEDRKISARIFTT